MIVFFKSEKPIYFWQEFPSKYTNTQNTQKTSAHNSANNSTKFKWNLPVHLTLSMTILDDLLHRSSGLNPIYYLTQGNAWLRNMVFTEKVLV